jgi:hypothetical protein
MESPVAGLGVEVGKCVDGRTMDEWAFEDQLGLERRTAGNRTVSLPSAVHTIQQPIGGTRLSLAILGRKGRGRRGGEGGGCVVGQPPVTH